MEAPFDPQATLPDPPSLPRGPIRGASGPRQPTGGRRTAVCGTLHYPGTNPFPSPPGPRRGDGRRRHAKRQPPPGSQDQEIQHHRATPALNPLCQAWKQALLPRL